MNEYSITHLAGLSGLGLVLASWLWSIGGRGQKWVRRFGSTAVIFLTVILTSFAMHRWSWWLLGLYPLLMPACFGYGGDEIWQKLFRRALFAFANVFCGLLFCVLFGSLAWSVFIIHFGVAMFTIWLGIRNPIYAPAEEFFVAMLLYLGLIMYPFLTQLH